MISTLEGKPRKVKNLRSATHVVHDGNGNPERVKFVEYTVVGLNTVWEDSMRHDVFELLNPHVLVD